MKIAFSDFWSHPRAFDPHNNFFVHCARAIREGIEVVDPNQCDVLFYGPFGGEHRRHTQCLKVFYTGENLQSNHRECDYSLTFDPRDHGGRNFRLPLWHLYIDWFGVGSYSNPEWLIPFRDLYHPPALEAVFRKQFCAIVYGKRVRSRESAIRRISAYRPVDVFGKANPERPIGDGELAKMQVLSRYRFSLCYENSISPGYVTEKLLHGKCAGGIPIYYGSAMAREDFNPDGFIMAASMSAPELLERIIELDQNDALYQAQQQQPLFCVPPSLDPVLAALDLIFRQQRLPAAVPVAAADLPSGPLPRIPLLLHDRGLASEDFPDQRPSIWAGLIHHRAPEREANRQALRELLHDCGIPVEEIVEQRPIRHQPWLLRAWLRWLAWSWVKSAHDIRHRHRLGKLSRRGAAAQLLRQSLRLLTTSVSTPAREIVRLNHQLELEQILRDKHLHAWTSFLKRQEDWLLMVEDDASIPEAGADRFRACTQVAWQGLLRTPLLYLDLAGGFPPLEVVTPTHQWDSPLGDSPYLSRLITTNTTCCYLVHRALVQLWCRRYAQAGFWMRWLPVDHLINALSFRCSQRNTAYCLHWPTPVLCHGSMQGSFVTSIGLETR